jgi:hypothetical protein
LEGRRPRRPQVRMSRVSVNRIIVGESIGGPAASPAAGAHVAGLRESHNYEVINWRAGGLAGRRYACRGSP